MPHLCTTLSVGFLPRINPRIILFTCFRSGTAASRPAAAADWKAWYYCYRDPVEEKILIFYVTQNWMKICVNRLKGKPAQEKKKNLWLDPALEEIGNYGLIARNAMPVPEKAKCLGGQLVVLSFLTISQPTLMTSTNFVQCVHWGSQAFYMYFWLSFPQDCLILVEHHALSFPCSGIWPGHGGRFFCCYHKCFGE